MSDESYLDDLLADMTNEEDVSVSRKELNNLNTSTVKDVELTNFDMDGMSLDDMAGFSDLFVDSSELETLMEEQENMSMPEELGMEDFSIPELGPDDMDFTLPSLDDLSLEVSLTEEEEALNFGMPMMETTMSRASFDKPREVSLDESEEFDDFSLVMDPVEEESDEFMDDVDSLLKTLSSPEENVQSLNQTEESENFFSLDGLMSMEEDNVLLDESDTILEDTTSSTDSDLEEDILGDSLMVEDELSEDNFLENDLMSIISEEEEASKGKKSKKGKKAKKAKKEKDPNKKGLFSKLFDNVHDAKSKRAHEKMLSDEEKRALRKQEREEKKAAKKAMKEDPAYLAEKEAKKQAKQDAKAQKQAAKEAKKREKEELKKQRRAEEEAEAMKDQGRINRVGATIVFVCFGAFLASVIFGSRTFSYNQSVAKAEEYFGNRAYTEAYNELRGVELKEEDVEMYDKVITVMYVNKQLNSYNNYYAMQMYPEALDSLLKGIKKYDYYLETAGQLGVIDDLDYVRAGIIEELRITFALSEKQAYKIINMPTQEEYSKKVIEAASDAD